MLSNYCISALKVMLILIALVSCGDDDNHLAGPSDSNVLIPLAINNYWLYEVEGYRNDTLNFEGADTTEIVSSITWDGNIWFYYLGGVGLHRDMSLRNDVNGILHLVILEEDPSDTTSELYYKYPASINDSWDAGFTITMVSTSDTITVPAGTFEDCYHYRFDCPEEAYYEDFSLWIKPGLGEVQRIGEFQRDADRIRDVWRLKEYQF